MLKRALFWMIFFAALFGCSKKFDLSPTDVVEKDKTIQIQGLKIVDKGKKYNLRVNIKNLTQKDILLMLNDFRCKRGGIDGRVEHAFFGAGERLMEFAPQQIKEFNFVCILPYKIVSGDYELTLIRGFDNPSRDRRTPGKEIVKNVSLVIPGR